KSVWAGSGVLLGKNHNGGDEDETRVADRHKSFLNRVPTLRRKEKQTALASAVGRFAQMFGKIERGIVGFPFVFHRDSLPLGRDARNVLLVEVVGHFEEPMFGFSLCLTDQMIA